MSSSQPPSHPPEQKPDPPSGDTPVPPQGTPIDPTVVQPGAAIPLTQLIARGLPYAGEIPVIGALFKSDLFQRDESELVIVITPYIVKPLDSPTALRVPTDGFTPAADRDRIVQLRQNAQDSGASAVIPPSAAALTPAGSAAMNLPAGAGFLLH